MSKVVLDNVVKRYGSTIGVDRISLDVADREFLALLGPSGCGKTSTMRMIAGLEDITEGIISIGETQVNGLTPARRNVAMAFENYGLYPHLTVFGNISYPLRIRKQSRSDIERAVIEIARLLHIDNVLDHKPGELSGGVRQRVSLARALIRKPSVFLLDEPISHLDADLRSHMRGELKRLHAVSEATMIYVTHDQLEAMAMADRIAVMNQGKLLQVGSPAEVFFRPTNRFVASFIGEPPMNILRGRVKRSGEGVSVTVSEHPFVTVGDERMSALLAASDAGDGTVDVGVRPPDFELRANGSSGLPAQVRLVENLGEVVLVTLDAGGERLRVQAPRDVGVAEGETLVLSSRPDRVHFFERSFGNSIGNQDSSAL